MLYQICYQGMKLYSDKYIQIHLQTSTNLYIYIKKQCNLLGWPAKVIHVFTMYMWQHVFGTFIGLQVAPPCIHHPGHHQNHCHCLSTRDTLQIFCSHT